MRFVALMYTEPARTATMTADERAETAHKFGELGTELLASGELRNGCGMDHPAQTRTFRWRGEPADGPFHTGDTLLSAYWVLDCASRERAEAIAGPCHEGALHVVERPQGHLQGASDVSARRRTLRVRAGRCAPCAREAAPLTPNRL